MNEYVVYRKGWPKGPWDEESDRYEWRTAAGYPGLIVRSAVTGALCGYVGLPPEHASHGKGHDDIDINVHGGLTYSGPCAGAICHVPQPGESDDVWWLGFDCAHAGDYCPGMEAAIAAVRKVEVKPYRIPTDPYELGFRGIYRTAEALRLEVERLAHELSSTGV